ncbi:LacI family DNA-binding transcriptional regulator [soil metagenome]
MKRPTIHAVAKEARVSVSTVSNVISGRHRQMTAETRERVLAAMEILQFRPNQVARSLVTNRTATIGLILGEVTNSLYPLVTVGAEIACRDAGYSLLLASADTEEAERRLVDVLKAKQVDAIVLFSVSYLTSQSEHLEKCDREGTPVVTLNRHLHKESPLSSVWFDHRAGAQTATSHLAELGHRRIAHISGPASRMTGVQRREGYEAALDHAGVTRNARLVYEGDYSFESGEAAMQRLLPERPTAVFVGGDAMALGAMRTIGQARLRIPDDISLVAFGNPDAVRYATPAMTTIDLPVADAGRVAIELALARIQEPQGKEVRTLGPTLLVRESTAEPNPGPHA